MLGVGLIALLSMAAIIIANQTSKKVSLDLRQRAAPTTSGLTAAFRVASSQTQYWLGQEFDVDILLSPGGTAVKGGQVQLTYDKTKLQVLKLTPGREVSQNPPMLSQVLRREIAEAAQTLYLDQAVIPPNPQAFIAESGIYGRIRFKALAEGATTIAFKFGRDPKFALNALGDTDVLAIEGGVVKDVLSHVHDLNLTITTEAPPPVPPTPPQPPTPPPSPPPSPPPAPPTGECQLKMRQEAGEVKESLSNAWEKFATFTPTEGGKVGKVLIKAGAYGTGSRTIICRISDASGQPLSLEVTSVSFQGDGVSAWRELDFASQSVKVEKETSYRLYCRGSESWKSLYWIWDVTKGKTYRLYLCP